MLVAFQEPAPSWVRNFNPLITTGGIRWPTRSGVYETLMIYNGAQGQWTPWLAEAYRYEDELTLVFDLRDGVRWSDGRPFTSVDVKFTFDLLASQAALDASGTSKFIERVEARDPGTVVFHLTRPYSPGLADISHQPIVPEHVWKDIPDPLATKNEDPVGTGPYTEVELFRSQVFRLGKNPYYWQDLKVDALQFPALASNDAVTMALLNGELDWAGAFVPAIDRIFVERDPAHNHYWFPLTGDMIFLYPNTTKPPLDDARVRKALSMAVDRPLVVKVAMYDYTRPADASGLNDVLADWKAPDLPQDWVTYDPDAAGKLLDEAGVRAGPDGKRPLSLELSVVTGWSDWVRAAQVVARNLGEIGVDVQVRSYDFGAWFERLGRGQFDLSISWSPSGSTPYPLYRGLMSAKAVKPVGTASDKNWGRFGSAEADALLDAFERTTDEAEQKRLAAEMQRLFARDAPALPLFASPAWGEYRTERFEGFPNADDPYARLSPNHFPDPLLVMTRLRPASE